MILLSVKLRLIEQNVRIIMKIAYYSDLHFEFDSSSYFKKILNNIDADVIVVAGDLISRGKTAAALHWLDDVVHVPLLYVPGNHDFYHTSKEEVDIELTKHQFHNVHILNTDLVELDGVRFLGATGWWAACSRRSRISINDFSYILDMEMNNNGIRWEERDKAFFEDHLQKLHWGKTVCISHHAPSFACIPEKLCNRAYNDVYANHWDEMVEGYIPDLWIHGHIHQQSNNFMIGSTRVVSNPYGYHSAKRLNPDFLEKCIVEI